MIKNRFDIECFHCFAGIVDGGTAANHKIIQGKPSIPFANFMALALFYMKAYLKAI